MANGLFLSSNWFRHCPECTVFPGQRRLCRTLARYFLCCPCKNVSLDLLVGEVVGSFFLFVFVVFAFDFVCFLLVCFVSVCIGGFV